MATKAKTKPIRMRSQCFLKLTSLKIKIPISIVQTAFSCVILQETAPAIMVYENILRIVPARNMMPDMTGSRLSRERRTISFGFRV